MQISLFAYSKFDKAQFNIKMLYYIQSFYV